MANLICMVKSHRKVAVNCLRQPYGKVCGRLAAAVRQKPHFSVRECIFVFIHETFIIRGLDLHLGISYILGSRSIDTLLKKK